MSKRYRPGPNAGTINPQSTRLRPPHSLTDREYAIARFLRVRWRWDFAAIARRLGRAEKDVQLALRNMRTTRIDPPRYSINVGPDAYQAFLALKRGAEPAWMTFNRLIGL